VSDATWFPRSIQLPEHVVTAQKHLKTLREKDPEMVKAAEEFFFLNF
jgi:hypothetical protein